MKKLIFSIVLAVFAFIGCNDNNKSTEQNVSNDVSNTESNETSNAQAPKKDRPSVEYKSIELVDKGDKFEITHSLGTIEVVKNPSKIVAFDLGALDTLEDLGLSDKVVGVPAKTLPPYLESFKSKESTGSVVEPNLEKINELQPDLIIISGRLTKFYDKLNAIAPTLFVSLDNANFISSFENKVLSLAKLYDKEDEATIKLNALKDEAQNIKQNIDPSKKALIVLTNSNKMSAFGPSSRFGIIHDVLGLGAADENIKVGTHGNSINSEYILSINPDFIFVVDRNVIVGNQERAQSILDNELIAKTNAAQNGKIIYLDPNYWYLSGGGLLSFKAMIEEIAQATK
ncbi:enterochelin ABC transporter substrate-binding protein [Campylobacter sp. MIT 99-7217]|uniref:siderophore ABC transporter substrate-binding protein n=1 Tax=Campylobacter sp. MIT 99-7217 TaxID=535091 RepID=UPI0011592CF1|nr:siderophore ABC transporter substrate-binding protein [Campylobacter sp. MIT 99-7217]TQR34520.1 enterochelin ABC transporter substrate-binding protein [Campylobacter sp. MIT 99-7217]